MRINADLSLMEEIPLVLTNNVTTNTTTSSISSNSTQKQSKINSKSKKNPNRQQRSGNNNIQNNMDNPSMTNDNSNTSDSDRVKIKNKKYSPTTTTMLARLSRFKKNLQIGKTNDYDLLLSSNSNTAEENDDSDQDDFDIATTTATTTPVHPTISFETTELTNFNSLSSSYSKKSSCCCCCFYCCCNLFNRILTLFFNLFCGCCGKSKVYEPRTIHIGSNQDLNKQKFSKNNVRNQKYSIFSFIPIVLYQQFSVFLNLYFLVMACSQFIPSIRIGYLYTYWAPLAFVISVTMLREAYDDFKRYLRDKELNSQLYKILTYDGVKMVPSSHLKVSDIIFIEKVNILKGEKIV
jgi:hypothetical protein